MHKVNGYLFNCLIDNDHYFPHFVKGNAVVIYSDVWNNTTTERIYNVAM